MKIIKDNLNRKVIVSEKLKRRIVINGYQDHLAISVTPFGRYHKLEVPLGLIKDEVARIKVEHSYNLVHLETTTRRSFDVVWTARDGSLFKGLVEGKYIVKWDSTASELLEETTVDTKYTYLAYYHETVRRYVSSEFVDEVTGLEVYDLVWETDYMNFLRRVELGLEDDVEDILIVNVPVELALENTPLVKALREYVLNNVKKRVRVKRVDINLVDKGLVYLNISRKLDPTIDKELTSERSDYFVEDMISLINDEDLLDKIGLWTRIDSDVKINSHAARRFVENRIKNRELSIEQEIWDRDYRVFTIELHPFIKKALDILGSKLEVNNQDSRLAWANAGSREEKIIHGYVVVHLREQDIAMLGVRTEIANEIEEMYSEDE